MKKSPHRKLKLFIAVCLGILILLGGSFYLYVSDYYRADPNAISAITNSSTFTQKGNLTILTPTIPSDTALIFYPGGKVEHTAYLPLLEQLREKGILCILVKMPFNLAFFDANAADKIYDQFPEIKNWYIGGHSLGGAMASHYASENPEKINGLILLGAYVYGDYPPSKALTIYGTFNSNLEKNIHYSENIVIIEGGNHAQFGNYGEQKGDPKATIGREEQQGIAVEAIMKFIPQDK